MNATDRLDSEQVFHDAQARQRAQTFARDPGRLVFRDDDWLDHETWIRPAITSLGELRGCDWYADGWLDEVLAQAVKRFDAACDRWRGLYRAAVAQREIRLKDGLVESGAHAPTTEPAHA